MHRGHVAIAVLTAGAIFCFLFTYTPFQRDKLFLSRSIVLTPRAASLSSVESADCKKRLDRLEDHFNHRRSAKHTIKKPPEGKKAYYDLYEPDATCLTEERFGNSAGKRYVAFGDGPKFVCGVDFLHDKTLKDNAGCLVYSVGSNNDISFERSVKDHIGCEIHTFDPTLTKEFSGSQYASFHPWGLGAENKTVRVEQKQFETASLRTFVSRLGHQQRRINILKIDCEGCELEALPTIFDDIKKKVLHVDQLLVEIHALNPASVPKIRNIFKSAEECGMRIAHKEYNHKGCDGSGCVEYVFVNDQYLRAVHRSIIC